ncbi:M23 family metallopeptidase [Entomospira nematocerorum]|uniref:M23 family metallopeptidase n=1 Tax=Entomospira nematocerorum TaxID=2719987 RepID=A0A968KV42_9SPIO|nr:M23 family metallopeptidase [Entomospira nematocera]NIZ46848.1 M23 family metallopeptidase [Entomospira nematocera]WDI33353.1 M23 family metallopeptidase [Entomospira nematocera]
MATDTKGKIGQFWQRLRRPLTIMLAPHDESRVISFRVSLLSLWGFGFSFITLVLVVIIFSTSNYRMGEQLDGLKGDISRITSDSDDLRSAIQSLPVLTDMLQDTVQNIESSSKIDFSSGKYGVHQVSGDLTDSSFSSNSRYQDNTNNELAQVEHFVGVLEDLIPMVATIGELFDTQQHFLSEIPTAWPVSGNRGFITMLFGRGRDPFTDGWQFHTGVDIAYSLGTPILAASDGVVIKTSYNSGGYGNVVLVKHGYGFYTRYAHMQRYTVQEGQRVKQGDQLGLMGATGRATGSHVHFEVLLGTEVEDPMRYLSIINPSLTRYIRAKA